MIKIDKIELNNFRFFIDDKKHNTFELGGQNMLVYGENGSGKSSLFKAFEFLSKENIPLVNFNENINIFKNVETYIEFTFNNDESIRIDSDHLSLENDYPYISNLSVVNPMLDYKQLLNISYQKNLISKRSGFEFDEDTGFLKEKKKNLYMFFQKILEDYPISENRILSELQDDEYFESFKNIIQNDLFDNINFFINMFGQNFKLTNIKLNIRKR